VVLIRALNIWQTECLQKGWRAVKMWTRETDTGVVLARGEISQWPSQTQTPWKVSLRILGEPSLQFAPRKTKIRLMIVISSIDNIYYTRILLVYIYIYIYILYIHIFIYNYEYIYIYLHWYGYTPSQTDLFMSVSMYGRTQRTCGYACPHAQTHTYLHTHIHTHKLKHTNVHTHIPGYIAFFPVSVWHFVWK